jgi:DNA-binding XRE family transcriptional regulator
LLPRAGCKTKRRYQFSSRLPTKRGTRKARPFPERLAQKAGLSRQTVSYVEQEVQNPTLDTLLCITAVLEIELEKIIAKARKTVSKHQA